MIKRWLAVCMMAGSSWGFAADMPAMLVKGKVLEVRDVASYTYLRLKTANGETWAAVSSTPVRKGVQVTIENAMTMNNFESKSLKKTFKTIVFGNLAGGVAPHAVNVADVSDIPVAKAIGENAYTVTEIVSKAAELKDTPVLLRGKIVKYNPGIMGKNWLHLRDGTGSEVNETNDVLVTTASQAKLGDIVTVKGLVHTDKDFGAGYSYKVLIEEATLQP